MLANHNQKKNWRKLIAPYEKVHVGRSIWQLINTFVPFLLLWYLAYQSLTISYLFTLLLAVPAAGLLVRIFIIFHDCCHGAFFPNRKVNTIIGMITGLFVFSPFEQWRYSHSRHHATSGNLDHRGVGDIWTLTVTEYLALPWYKRLAYRLYRNPLIMFGFGAVYLFLISYRFNRKGARKKERYNTYLTNLLLVGVISLLCWWLGWKSFLLVHGPIFLIAGTAGVWLFYVQHQFEGTYFEKGENWNHVDAALKGSSFYQLPRVLNWFTGSIGYHHIHHLSPRVPNYNLRRAHEEVPMFQEIKPITLWTSLKSITYRIWDEDRKKLMGFGYIKEYLYAQKQKSFEERSHSA